MFIVSDGLDQWRLPIVVEPRVALANTKLYNCPVSLIGHEHRAGRMVYDLQVGPRVFPAAQPKEATFTHPLEPIETSGNSKSVRTLLDGFNKHGRQFG